VGVFKTGPGAGSIARLAGYGDTIGGRQIFRISPMVAINNAGQVLFDGYAPFNTSPVRKTWTASVLHQRGSGLPTSPGVLECFNSPD
jgi:hypothetical protein